MDGYPMDIITFSYLYQMISIDSNYLIQTAIRHT